MQESVSQSFNARTLASIRQSLRTLRDVWDDMSIDEIQINGPNDVFIRRGGRDAKLEVDLSASMIESAINLVAAFNDKVMGERSKHYILSARLPGVRIEAMMPPVSLKGPSMCIRRHASRVVPLHEYVEKGICTPQQAKLLEEIVQSNSNFLVSGGTYSGKTTLVNALLALIPKDQRLFSIEQVAELRIESPNYTSLECDPEQGVTAARALQVGMRFSPHRIIVGELRGGEAVDFLMACNTGHPGSCTTIHADSARDALTRLEDLCMQAVQMPYSALRARIGQSIAWVIQIQMHTGQRRISEIVQVQGYERVADQYLFNDCSTGEKA